MLLLANQAPFEGYYPLAAGVVILEILAMFMAWCVIRLSWMLYKVWIDQMHENEMPRLLKRMEQAGLYKPPDKTG
ncbi:hypothetical protein KDL29_05880 [bacterium]|nr:hypothetical protein [bacterium]UNM09372.1 MAG: hypothetical protein H7A35_04780 [Planctomycetales bacterium]